MMAQRNLFRLRQLLGSHAAGDYFTDNLEDAIARRITVLRLDRGVDPQQSGIAWRVGKRRDAVGQTGFLAQLPVEARAAAIAKDRRKKINCRHVGMRNLGDVPGKRQTRQLSDKFLMSFAAAELRRFVRDEKRPERFGRMIVKKIAELLTDRVRVDVADDDESQIVRYVPRLVVPHHIVTRQLIEDIKQTDDRQPVGVTLVSG